MAENTAAAEAAIPSSADLTRAERFTHEAFVHPGEDPALALAPGTPRRRALDLALHELDEGAKAPSTKWRRRWSLLLGLERVLSEDEPRLADGTLLNPHQVDALSGTLTALLAEAMRRAAANGNGVDADEVVSAAPVLAVGTDEHPRDEPEPPPPEPEPEDEEEDEDEDDEPESAEALDIELDIEDLPEEAVDETQDYDDEPIDGHVDDDVEIEGAPEDPNAHKRFWFEHATGAGKTVAAMGFVEASRLGGILILTHRRNLVDQFIGEITTRGYAKRLSPPLLDDEQPKAATTKAGGPVTVETYQWFVRNAGRISDAYTIVICDEAHTALGDKTSAAIRAWTGPVFIGMTATGALIARHVTDLFPTQTSRFDLAQAARRGVIAPLRSIRIPPGPGVRTIAKVPLRRGEVDVEFDQEMLAELLDQLPFNLAIADLYKSRFNGVPGVVYAAGVRHAYNVAEAFREIGIKAEAVSGETKKRELAAILARYEAGDIDVLVNAQLLAEGWNSPRATVCMHLAPTASKRIYQQRVGRVTRRHPGKEAGVVVDFVHPATRHDDPVVTLHSLLDRDVYRGGAIVVGPVRRGRGRRVRVERRVIPVCAEETRRHEVFERELWRIAVEHLDWGEQHMWAALAGARVQPNGWRRARAMLHFDKTGELKRRFLITAVERNKNPQLRLRALAEIAASRDAEAFDLAHDVVGTWARDERREGTKALLQALAERRIGRRDQANAWIWRLAEYTRDVHEEYAVQRWPETKRLLGLLVNSSGQAHARNARRLVHASRTQDRRLQAAVLAAAVGHTPEAESVLRDARTRLARKPSALSRELLRNFPKGRKRNRRRKRRGAGENGNGAPQAEGALVEVAVHGGPGESGQTGDGNGQGGGDGQPKSKRARARARAKAHRLRVEAEAASAVADGSTAAEGVADEPERAPAEPSAPSVPAAPSPEQDTSAQLALDGLAEAEPVAPKRRSRAKPKGAEDVVAVEPVAVPADEVEPVAPKRRSRAKPKVEVEPVAVPADEVEPVAPKRRSRAKPKVEVEPVAVPADEVEPVAPKRRSRAKPKAESPVDTEAIADAATETPKPRARAKRKVAAEATAPIAVPAGEAEPVTPKRRTRATPKVDAETNAATTTATVAEKPKPKPRASRAKPKPKAAEAATNGAVSNAADAVAAASRAATPAD